MLKRELNYSDFLDKAERVFTVASLLLYMNAVIPLLIIQGASEGDGIDFASFNFTPLNLLFITNYLVTACLLILRWNKVLPVVSRNYILLVLTLMIPLSYTWSAMPNETFSGSVGMIGTILFGTYLASRFSIKEQLNLIGLAFSIAVALSILFAIGLPKYGINGGVHAGALRGVWTSKNVAGKFFVLGLCVFLNLAMKSGAKSLFPWLWVIASSVLILASSSTNALINGTAVALVVLSGQFFKLRKKSFLLVSFFLLLSGWAFSILFIDIATVIVGALGKEMTFTGRTDIWSAVINKILERPWLGYGFNGFWHGLDGESADVIRTLRWPVPNSHNGYLDFILQLGLVGFFLFILVFWKTLIKAYIMIQHKFRWEYMWILSFLYYMVAINFAEPSLLYQNDLFWLLLTSIVISTGDEFRITFDVRKQDSNSNSKVLAINI